MAVFLRVEIFADAEAWASEFPLAAPDSNDSRFTR